VTATNEDAEAPQAVKLIRLVQGEIAAAPNERLGSLAIVSATATKRSIR
jgi:hypothetical protein